jgi:hypothetical protein
VSQQKGQCWFRDLPVCSLRRGYVKLEGPLYRCSKPSCLLKRIILALKINERCDRLLLKMRRADVTDIAILPTDITFVPDLRPKRPRDAECP